MFFFFFFGLEFCYSTRNNHLQAPIYHHFKFKLHFFLLLGCYLISIQNLIFTLEITRVLNWVFFLDICLPKPFSSSSANTFVGKSGFKNYLSPVEKKNKSCKNRQKSNYFNPHPEYSQNNLGIRILISITNLGQEIFQGHF